MVPRVGVTENVTLRQEKKSEKDPKAERTVENGHLCSRSSPKKQDRTCHGAAPSGGLSSSCAGKEVRQVLKEELRELGEELRQMRKEMRMTQEKMAEALDMESCQLSRYENGSAQIGSLNYRKILRLYENWKRPQADNLLQRIEKLSPEQRRLIEGIISAV